MTTTEIAVREEGRQMAVLTNEQLQFIAGTEFVPPGLRGNLPAILACVATGRALGLADMTALRSINIIDGKATFSAELMVMLARKAGHSIVGEVSPTAAKVTGKRADNGDTMNVEWTLEQASKIKRKGKALTDGDNWKNYPEAMLWARAASQLCRMLFADCFAGATYTDEELEGTAADPFDHKANGEFVVESSQMTELPGETFEDAFGGDPADPADGKVSLSASQKKKLDVLVGQLRESGRLHTEHLFAAVGRMRDVDPEDLAGAMPGAVDGEGVLHYSPLRDTLSKAEASNLIDRLSKLQDAA